MITSLKKQQQDLAEMSKKVAWTEMARKVAHEVKNPLTPIQLSIEHLLKVYEDGSRGFERALRESVSYIIGEVENLRRISQEFMELARDTAIQKEEFDFRDLIIETLGPYKKVLAERIHFREAFLGKNFLIAGDRAKLKIAMRNLTVNAVEAIRHKGEIEVRVWKEDQALRVEIKDSGAGMDAKMLERIFEPYFSTKEGGTGLGLPIARKIIEEHGGTIEVSSSPGRGTSIFIRLPLT
jgi:nitrogen fixation/metabolism regulation signal transduction histidine kinase